MTTAITPAEHVKSFCEGKLHFVRWLSHELCQRPYEVLRAQYSYYRKSLTSLLPADQQVLVITVGKPVHTHRGCKQIPTDGQTETKPLDAATMDVCWQCLCTNHLAWIEALSEQQKQQPEEADWFLYHIHRPPLNQSMSPKATSRVMRYSIDTANR